MKNLEFSFDAISKIKNIDFFGNIGNHPNNITDKYIIAPNFDSAQILFLSDDWRNFREEKNGDLSEFLFLKYNREYNKFWDIFLDYFHKYWIEEIEKKIQESIVINNLKQEIIIKVQWDLLNYVLECSFSKCSPPIFFENIFDIYHLGYIPCGFNNQKFLIF